MLPQGEKTRKAVRWISDNLKEDTTATLKQLINRAISKFDLNPREAEELVSFYRDSQQKQ